MTTESSVSAGSAQRILLTSGLRVFKGRLSEEYLPELKPWAKAAKVYQEMMDDAVVGSLLDAIMTPLLSTEFQVVPAKNTSEDIAAAKFLEKCLFEMPDMEWREHVEEALSFLGFGFSLAEKVLYKKDDGKVYLRSLLPIGQETIQDWGDEPDELGNFREVRQRDPTLGGIYTAPYEKMLHFTFRGRKKNPEGRSLLRAIYRPWYFKKNLEVIEAIGAERDVGNVPVLTLPEGEYITESDMGDIEEKLKTFRVDEAAYMVLPPNTKLEAYGGGNKVYNIRNIIRDYQNLIRQRFFAGFISQGAEQIGTQALAREMTTFFGMVIRSIQTRMMEVWKRQLVPYIFEYNNFSIDTMPVLHWQRSGKENIQVLAQAVGTLVGARVLTNTPDLEDHIRGIMSFPPLAEGVPRASEGDNEQEVEGLTMDPEKSDESKEEMNDRPTDEVPTDGQESVVKVGVKNG
jgi:hypothetical protein